jgi:alkylation response protein AidB-like acyl-CoA dehydrogenase
VRANFTDTQDALREAVRDLLADHAGSAAVRAAAFDGDGFDADLWELLVGMGVTDLPGAVEQGIVAEEIGRVVAPVPYVEHQVATAALASASAGHDLLGEFTSGTALGVYAPGQVVRLEDGNLHGRLRAVPHAAAATHLVVDADDGDRRALAVVEAAGTRRETLPTMDRTRPLADVVLDVEAVLVVPASATPAAPAWLTAATLYAHDLVGVGQTCLDMGVAHAGTREQFGRIIGTYQAVSHRLVDMYVALESARSHTYHAAWAVAAGEEVAELAAGQAKASASRAAVMCAEGAIQVHGGIGFTWEHDLHLYLKRARSSAVLAGATSAHLRRIADLIGV